MKKITLTQSQIDTILKNNYTKKQIKDFLKVSWPTVLVVCHEYKIQPNLDQRTYKPNDNYFKNWSNEMAYFLGFIVGDGHVRKQNNLLMINIKKTDEKIIESFKDALEYTGPIYTINKKDGQTQCSLTVSSKEIVNDLMKLGLSGNKTYDFDWIIGMPDEYISHFVRGIFDADGCIHINTTKFNYSANIVGTYKLTENIKEKYNKLFNNSFGCLKPNKNIQLLDFNGKYNALAFLDWIYTDSTQSTRLERKYDLYLQLKNEIAIESKTPNNSKINQEIADQIRIVYASGKTVKNISELFNQSEALIHDVVQNRSWCSPTYTPHRKKQDTILISYENKTQSIKDWSEETGIPYSTIDRRYRANLPLDQIFSKDGLPKIKSTQSEKDKNAYELAQNLRMDYKNGLVGKKLYEKYDIPKSRAMDILANRTCKENKIWWKG